MCKENEKTKTKQKTGLLLANDWMTEVSIDSSRSLSLVKIPWKSEHALLPSWPLYWYSVRIIFVFVD